MIVMIEEIPKAPALAAQFGDDHVMLEQLHVRRAWVQHHHELARLFNKAGPREQPLFMGLPLAIADAKKWNELLLLEGSKRVKALDWPPPKMDWPTQMADSIRKEVDRTVLSSLKSMTRFIA